MGKFSVVVPVYSFRMENQPPLHNCKGHDCYTTADLLQLFVFGATHLRSSTAKIIALNCTALILVPSRSVTGPQSLESKSIECSVAATHDSNSPSRLESSRVESLDVTPFDFGVERSLLLDLESLESASVDR